MRLFLALIVLSFSSSNMAHAADRTAASCSAADIQTAIDECLVTGGGTVSIPVCSDDDTWMSDHFVMVKSDTSFKLLGAGMDQTIIGFQDGQGHSPMFLFEGTGLKELGQMTLRGCDTYGVARGVVIASGETEELRVHHLRMQKFKTSALDVCQNPDRPIVIDHCKFGDQYMEKMNGIRVFGTNASGKFYLPQDFGMDNPNACFIEDSTFEGCASSVSGIGRSSVVFRHNTVTNATLPVMGHGPGLQVGCDRDAPLNSGSYILEAYGNTFSLSGACLAFAGGGGMITENIFEGCDPGILLEMAATSDGVSCTLADGCPYSTSDGDKCLQSPLNIWIWGNTCTGCGPGGEIGAGDECIREGEEYHLRAPQAGDAVESYTRYPYPHPLVSGAPYPDAGVPGDGPVASDAGSGDLKKPAEDAAGSEQDAGGSEPEVKPEDDGCSCRLEGEGGPGMGLLVGVWVLFVLLNRRRCRR